MTYLLGLTGSIGMGKSTTAGMFRDEAIPVWDADVVVHRLYAKNGAAVAPMAEVFPASIVDGAISRDILKRLIANDPSAFSKIEGIVHPLVAQDRADFIAGNQDPILLFDIPLLFETGADHWLSGVLVVTAPADIQKKRVMARPGMTEEQFNLIRDRQMPNDQKVAKADFIIETLTLTDTKAAVERLIAQIKGQLDA